MRSVKRALVVALISGILDVACGSSTSPSTVSETFGGMVAVGGVATREFLVARAGTAKLSLSVVASSSVVLGLGLGNAGPGPSCDLTVTTKTSGTSAAQISAAVNPGRYCVQISDPGTLTEPVSFSLRIEHP